MTGYGLAGHALEMAEGAGLTFEIDVASPAGHRRGRAAGRSRATSPAPARATASSSTAGSRIEPGADPLRLEFAFDAQTSGGLLIAVAPENVPPLLVAELRDRGASAAAVVGRVVERAGEIAVVLR